MANLPTVVFVLGGPGAGKGTQCERIVKEFGYVHLSAGDLLREERSKPGSEFGELIEGHIRAGSIVPVEITCSLIEKAMAQHQAGDCRRSKFLIDGFPRNKDNLDGWSKQMSHKVNFLFVLFFDCDEKVCVGRCLGRGEAGSGRSDDNTESLQKRIVTYNQSTKPIIDHYDSQGRVQRIDASKNVDEVYEDVRKVFLHSESKV